ncbi:hypothetical protein IF1G_03490 [Cordyceps javanica]|uniref:Uncharacterized protein n=1 Tax=Cordyceps javanica TaxID=43265 RepID=A0A545V7P7_9HYPO|nr:hypothetical protein IF1G_03490 [Cordyceps javanica]
MVFSFDQAFLDKYAVGHVYNTPTLIVKKSEQSKIIPRQQLTVYDYVARQNYIQTPTISPFLIRPYNSQLYGVLGRRRVAEAVKSQACWRVC